MLFFSFSSYKKPHGRRKNYGTCHYGCYAAPKMVRLASKAARTIVRPLVNVWVNICKKKDKRKRANQPSCPRARANQDGVLKNKETYEIMDAELVGLHQDTSLVLGKHSGRHAFRSRLQVRKRTDRSYCEPVARGRSEDCSEDCSENRAGVSLRWTLRGGCLASSRSERRLRGPWLEPMVSFFFVEGPARWAR